MMLRMLVPWLREVKMTILDSVPMVEAENPRALIEEAKRHRRRRRWFTTCVVALVVAVSLGFYAGLSWSGVGGPSKGTPILRLLHRWLAWSRNTNAYRECPGSARVGPATSPDGLPAMASRTNNVGFVVFVARSMARGPYLGFTHRIVAIANPQRSQGHPCGTRRRVRLDARDLWPGRGEAHEELRHLRLSDNDIAMPERWMGPFSRRWRTGHVPCTQVLMSGCPPTPEP